MALLNKQLNETPPKLCESYHYISEEFSDLVDSMLEKDPENRISIDELIERLKILQANRPDDIWD
jgi:serine/threonine protein kinase